MESSFLTRYLYYERSQRFGFRIFNDLFRQVALKIAVLPRKLLRNSMKGVFKFLGPALTDLNLEICVNRFKNIEK